MDENQMNAIQLRQLEVEEYDRNIRLYTTLISTLDGNWDEDLVHLKNLEVQEAARQCPMDRLERLAVLQQHDQFTKLLKTETVERSKSAAILAVLMNQA